VKENPGMRQHRGFTLIELLIVVAIIAILAAIAVPNFLEAQTRAKVSRAKSDHRTLATGIEAYRVDNNKYPSTPSYIRGTNTVTNILENRWSYLTTPIAYITSIPDDVFGDRVLLSDYATGLYRCYDYCCFDQPNTYETNVFKPYLVNNYHYSVAMLWYMASQGPDLQAGLAVGQVGLPYDPTNGTVSPGDIMRVGPGGPVVGGSGS
jgi:type II secretion system protein G